MNKTDTLSSAIIKSISVCIVLLGTLSAILLALYFYNTNGEFLSAIKLSRGFYFPALVTLFAFALVYTPISYGISKYFINSKENRALFSDIFYLFKNPRLLQRAVLITLVKRIIIMVCRFGILLAALLFECLIFVAAVTVSGNNIFDFEQSFFQSAAEFAVSNRFFIVCTVIQWLVVVILLLYVKMRYILCKYVLICNPLVSVREAIVIGKRSISCKTLKVVAFYVKYFSEYVLVFLTFGRYSVKDSFSSFAVSLVKSGMQDYFDKS
jgi:hypothetical protein